MLSAALLALLTHTTPAASVQGDIVVVEDAAGDQHNPGLTGLALKLCTFGARGLYDVLGDDYDAVVVFSTHPMNGFQFSTSRTPAGWSVRQDDDGVAYGSFLIPRPPSDYGSASTLKHCVYMGPLSQAPVDPDAPSDAFGTPGLKAIDVMGHEFGHHWLVNWAFDQGDGPQALHRSNMRDMPDADPISSSQLHYSALSDSHSVMYGSFITALGGDRFLLEGGTRKYGPIDQYLMGLRAPDETPPMLVIDDGSRLGLYENPLAPGQSEMKTGTAVMVSVDDIVRAQGARSPAYPAAQRCFRTAFILVTQQGHTATPDEIAHVDAWRQRWGTWFPEATDGRGRVETRLVVENACPPDEPMPLDAGVSVVTDAGQERMDSGSARADAAVSVVTDAGTHEDAGLGTLEDDGCGCQVTTERGACAWVAAVVLLARRARHTPSRRRKN